MDVNNLVILNDQGGGIMDTDENVTMTLRAQEHGHQPVVCYVPEQNHCATYREGDVSATLQTGYHYGGGGDVALILECAGLFRSRAWFLVRRFGIPDSSAD